MTSLVKEKRNLECGVDPRIFVVEVQHEDHETRAVIHEVLVHDRAVEHDT